MRMSMVIQPVVDKTESERAVGVVISQRYSVLAGRSEGGENSSRHRNGARRSSTPGVIAATMAERA